MSIDRSHFRARRDLLSAVSGRTFAAFSLEKKSIRNPRGMLFCVCACLLQLIKATLGPSSGKIASRRRQMNPPSRARWVAILIYKKKKKQLQRVGPNSDDRSGGAARSTQISSARRSLIGSPGRRRSYVNPAISIPFFLPQKSGRAVMIGPIDSHRLRESRTFF